MSLGPVELLIVSFPGNQFKGEIAPALKELVDNGTIRVIDILFVNKDENGKVEMVEINDLDDDDLSTFDPVVSDVTGLLTEDDIQHLSKLLDNNSSAAMMLFENTWATKFRDALLNANAQLVLNERIPRAVIEEVAAAREQARAGEDAWTDETALQAQGGN
jgi:Family of unknown function (DUF6325)